ncbi:jg19946 [Pararge aegeria aegeria]|uniref:Jg19946 protein n=1 Tax=Pararge aegeria aegeria TaxID=348720 RepID=A0A8S4RUX8_9NEOP|nr:jg19946 [Pararge aegeria aegeria]
MQTISYFPLAPQFTSTVNGRPVLQIGYYRYYRNNRSRGRKATWFCARNSSKPGCKASVIVVDGMIVDVKNEHNH